MRTMLKVFIFFMIIVTMIIMPQNMVKASLAEKYVNDIGGDLSETYTNMNTEINSVTNIVSKLLGFLQVISAVMSVIIIASTGFRYIVETPEVKEEIKKTMLPMIVGIIFVFFATSIAQFFMGMFAGGIQN